jgi:menaquinone-dependent protoporphyrinogen oxidase
LTTRKLSRRDFLKTAGIALGASALTCSGLGYLATLPPKITMINTSLGEANTMNKNILITYATKAGSTVEIASIIGESLSKRGFTVDVKSVKEKPSIESYSAVVLGSAIRMGGWLPEMVEFIKTNQSVLQSRPVALFTVHILNTGADETSRAARLAYLNSVRPLVSPVDEVFFTGSINIETLSFVDRLMVKMVKSPIGDFRNWDQIRDWSENVNL